MGRFGVYIFYNVYRIQFEMRPLYIIIYYIYMIGWMTISHDDLRACAIVQININVHFRLEHFLHSCILNILVDDFYYFSSTYRYGSVYKMER